MEKGQEIMLNMKKIALTLLVAVAAVSVANANVTIGTGPADTTKITTSQTWSPSNGEYRLNGQIVIMPGATLTIEPGTIIRGLTQDGSLAVAAGAKIYVNGTKDNPVIMTALNDDFATWQAQAKQWGNLTIMGNGYISASQVTGNSKKPEGTNTVQMEGLTPPAGENWAHYGGDNDDDDSGAVTYLSIRYGGKVVGDTNELNGLSLGGVGRETEMHHIEIMNNVDDGIEIWGGTVNMKYVAIWNVGDDSFDLDQGWRGKAQFGLIVQGYSVPGSSPESGVADRCFEMDGSEELDAAPVTTAAIYNFTAIGQPGGDDGMGFRDGARVQFRNCIFLEIGGELITGDTGDYGVAGQGGQNTLSWQECWTTDADDVAMASRGFDLGTLSYGDLYGAQDPNGKLCEVKDSVFCNIDYWGDAAGTSGDSINVVEDTSLGQKINDNVIRGNANLPIVSRTRGPETTDVTASIYPITSLDPRAANDAITSVNTAPADGFFTPVKYRGAFSPSHNWLLGWTAADQYGMLVDVADNDETPEATAEIAKVQTSTTFQTEANVWYTVEKSSDMKTWTPVESVEGDGTEMSVEDLDSFDSAKFYRVVRQ